VSIKSIYRTSEGEAEIIKLYDLQVARLGFPVEECTVSTRFGTTHLLVCGPKDGQALVCFQGGNSTNPLTLISFAALIKKYRIYAPDTPGHPGKSTPVRLSPRNDDYGLWVADLLDALEFERSILVGGSYGAGIILRSAAIIPERIEKVILVNPSGIVSIPVSTMFFRLLIPLGLYYLSHSRAGLIRELRPMFAEDPIPEDVIEMTQASFDHVNIEPAMPRNVTRAELARLTAPVLVITAEKDELFPAKAVVRRAKEVFPNLVAVETIAGSPHFISPDKRAFLCERMDRFIELGT